MKEFLSSYVSENTSVAYTSTKLLKEQLDSVRSMILVIGGLIGCIMAFAGLINFTNMIITNIITRRHEFATMQSIGMTGKQLRRLMVYEGIYYAAGADIIGGAVAAILAKSRKGLFGPTVSSRSCGPEPCTRITTGTFFFPTGNVIVPGSLKPSAPTVISRSSIFSLL